MTTLGVQYADLAAVTYDITAADLAGANSGQRPDLLGRKQAVYRVGTTLYKVNAAGNQLVAAQDLVARFSLDAAGAVTGLVGPKGEAVALGGGATYTPWTVPESVSVDASVTVPTDIAIPGTAAINELRVAFTSAGTVSFGTFYRTSGSSLLWGIVSESLIDTATGVIVSTSCQDKTSLNMGDDGGTVFGVLDVVVVGNRAKLRYNPSSSGPVILQPTVSYR